MHEVDVVIIGAGISGLCACKTYLQIHANAKVQVIDQNSALGGTWCKERLFHGLNTNNIRIGYEYPDFPYDEATYGVKEDDFVPGETVSRYLQDYAQKFGVLKHILFNTSVQKLEEVRTGDSQKWLLTMTSTDGSGPERHFQTGRVIVASGLTTRPLIPRFTGEETFGNPILHSRDFPQNQHLLKTSKRAVVIGAGKSAHDIVYAHASAGIEVDWIIRSTGRGPTWIGHPYVQLGRWKVVLELLATARLFSWLIPSTWQEADGYSWPHWFLHETRVGRWITDAIATEMANNAAELTGWEKHPATTVLRPWHRNLEAATASTALNYPSDFFEHVRSGRVRVHIADIERLSPGTVHLENGEAIDADVIFCATGWRFVPPFLDGYEEDLGLPHVADSSDPVISAADDEIRRRFLAVRTLHSPEHPVQEPSNEHHEVSQRSQVRALNMYRFMVPPKHFPSRNIVFLNHCLCVRTIVLAHLQSLWAIAYMDGKLEDQDQLSQQEVLWQATLHSQCTKWTQPYGAGARLPDMTFETTAYFDLLLKDLGLRRWRKGGVLKEIFSPYLPPDYKTVVEEWLAGTGKKENV